MASAASPQRIGIKAWVGAIVIAGLMVSTVDASERRMYRYTDADGTRVIRDHIPPQFVSEGYDILRPNGMLIERVPRTLSQAERDAKYGTAEEQRMAEETKRAQEEADRRLLTIFSHPDDAVRARDRRLEALDVIIGVHRGNIINLRADFDQTQHQAAIMERGGRAVPQEMIDKMNSLNRQINRLEEDIRVKEMEKDEIRVSYARDIERLKFLRGVPAEGSR